MRKVKQEPKGEFTSHFGLTKQSEINLLSDAGTAKLAQMSDDNAVYTDYLKFQLKSTKSDESDTEENYRRFFAIARQYRGMTELSATMLHDLVDRIEVHESQGTRGHKTQRVEIHYRFVEEGLPPRI